ncbi:MAG: hypothetical protein ABWK00_00045 [Desulfurococcaceae archaeon]
MSLLELRRYLLGPGELRAAASAESVDRAIEALSGKPIYARLRQIMKGPYALLDVLREVDAYYSWVVEKAIGSSRGPAATAVEVVSSFVDLVNLASLASTRNGRASYPFISPGLHRLRAEELSDFSKVARALPRPLRGPAGELARGAPLAEVVRRAAASLLRRLDMAWGYRPYVLCALLADLIQARLCRSIPGLAKAPRSAKALSPQGLSALCEQPLPRLPEVLVAERPMARPLGEALSGAMKFGNGIEAYDVAVWAFLGHAARWLVEPHEVEGPLRMTLAAYSQSILLKASISMIKAGRGAEFAGYVSRWAA